jgi:hypothetical protein
MVTPSTVSVRSETAQVNNASPRPGDTIQITGGSTEPFAPNQLLGIELRSDPVQLATVLSTDAGTYVADVQIPANTAPGQHSIVVSGLHRNGGRLESVATINVVSSSQPQPTATGGATSTGDGTSTSSIAATGWSPHLLAVALALATSGGLLMRWARRRQEDDYWLAPSVGRQRP